MHVVCDSRVACMARKKGESLSKSMAAFAVPSV